LVLKYDGQIGKTLLMGYLRLRPYILKLEYIRALSTVQRF
jgi:hypothetical protein